jgi:hypothetical protein
MLESHEGRWIGATVGLLLALLIWGYIVATPVGEGPDEQAHLFYVRMLQPKLHVPDIALLGSDGHAYELHHPPTYYALAALWARSSGLSLDYPAIRNPGFPHSKRGGGYLAPPTTPATLAAHRGVWRLRALGLATGLLTAWALFYGALLECGTRRLAWLVALPCVLAPQLAFLNALVSNDGLVIALSSVCLALGRRLLTADDGDVRIALSVGLLAALAIWTKGSALFLLAPLGFLALALWRRGGRRQSAALLLPPTIAGAAFLALWAPRFAVFEAVYGHALGLANHPDLLVRYPFWWIQLWGSFFAKLTQFQLRLPWPLYLLFVPFSLLALRGLLQAWRERRMPASPALYWAAALLANVSLLAYFLIFVDFQHQGRLLWPSAAALVGCAAIAARELAERRQWRPSPGLVGAAIVVFFAVGLIGIGVIVADEGWPPRGVWSGGLLIAEKVRLESETSEDGTASPMYAS